MLSTLTQEAPLFLIREVRAAHLSMLRRKNAERTLTERRFFAACKKGKIIPPLLGQMLFPTGLPFIPNEPAAVVQ